MSKLCLIAPLLVLCFIVSCCGVDCAVARTATKRPPPPLVRRHRPAAYVATKTKKPPLAASKGRVTVTTSTAKPVVTTTTTVAPSTNTNSTTTAAPPQPQLVTTTRHKLFTLLSVARKNLFGSLALTSFMAGHVAPPAAANRSTSPSTPSTIDPYPINATAWMRGTRTF